MIEIIGIVLLIISVFDARILRTSNASLFQEVFSIPIWAGLILSIELIFLIALSDEKLKALTIFLGCFLLPLYLLKRRRFIQTLAPNDQKLLLTSDCLGVVLTWFFWSLWMEVLITYLKMAQLISLAEFDELIISTIFSSIVIGILIYRGSLRFSDKGFISNMALKKREGKFFNCVIVPTVAGLFFAFISAYFILHRGAQPDTPLGEIMDSAHSSFFILIFLILAVFIAPFLEEVVFRGYFFHVLCVLKGKKWAVIIIGAIFAGLHYNQYWGDWLAIGVITLLGFVLTFLRAWTQSTLTSVIMHYVYNAGVTVIPAIMLMLGNPSYFQYHIKFSSLNFEQKEQLLLESIQANPKLTEAYNDLAWVYTQENQKLDQALILIDKALSVSPDSTTFLDTKAEVLTKLNRYQVAREIRKMLIKKVYSSHSRAYQIKRLEELK